MISSSFSREESPSVMQQQSSKSGQREDSMFSSDTNFISGTAVAEVHAFADENLHLDSKNEPELEDFHVPASNQSFLVEVADTTWTSVTDHRFISQVGDR